MKLKKTALLVCIVCATIAIFQTISTINYIFIDKIDLSINSYMWQFLSIIQDGIVAYFFYLFYRKIK